MNFFLSIILLGLFSSLSAQNLYDSKVLPVGEWEYFIDDTLVEKGTYKIISLDTVKVLGTISTFYEVRIGNARVFMPVKGRHEELVSVRDGVWENYTMSGEISSISNWSNGVEFWERRFNSKGELIEFDHLDIESGIIYYDFYRNNIHFKREFYLPSDGNNKKVEYYPSMNLEIRNGEISLMASFLYNPVNTEQIRIFSKDGKPELIRNIYSTTDDVQVRATNGEILESPILLKPGDTLNFQVIYDPHPSKPSTDGSLVIETDDVEYEILISASSNHVDRQNVEELKLIELSKERDEYLVVSSLGTVTEAYVYEEAVDGFNGSELFHTLVQGQAKIDLKQFDLGEYILFIPSCDMGGWIRLIVEK